MLVALAIFAGMAAMLYSGLFAAHRATDGVQDSLLRLHEVRTSLDVMRREIEAAEPIKSTDPLPSLTLIGKDYYGSASTDCTFTTFRSPSGGSLMVRYYVVESDDRKLALHKQVRRPWATPDEAEDAELIDDIGGFLVEVRDGDKWKSTWDGQITGQGGGQDSGQIRITLTVHAKTGDMTLRETAKPAIGGGI